MDISMDIPLDTLWTSPWTSPWISRWTPYGYAHQIEGKQARRFMYMNRARSLPRPAALEQQPECRRPVEAASRAVRGGRAGGVQERHGGRPQGQRHVGLHRPRRAGLQPVNLIAVFAFQRLASVEQWHIHKAVGRASMACHVARVHPAGHAPFGRCLLYTSPSPRDCS